ncbi:MAG: AAA family ATPase [Terriglobales bacterium]
MSFKFTIFAGADAERQHLEAALLATGRVTLTARPLPLPAIFDSSEPQWHQLVAQAPDALLIELPASSPETALALLSWMKGQSPGLHIIAVGALSSPQLIVEAMRAGANEFLEQPLRPAQIEEALVRCEAARGQSTSLALRPATRGKLIAVLGARGGCGATTVAVNLAVAMQHARREADTSPAPQRRSHEAAVALIDLAPLGHTALFLNLKPQFSVSDLLGNLQRMDAAMLTSLMVRHDCGLELIAGASAPLAPGEPGQHTAWIELLLRTFPIVVADLSTRVDNITTAACELADRILFVTQTDMVSLWSAAKVRQHLDPQSRLRFELVLNRFTDNAEVDFAALESITRAPVFWKVPNAHATVMQAVEHGRLPADDDRSELARNFRDLAATLLGRAPVKKRRWLPFLRPTEVTGS